MKAAGIGSRDHHSTTKSIMSRSSLDKASNMDMDTAMAASIHPEACPIGAWNSKSTDKRSKLEGRTSAMEATRIGDSTGTRGMPDDDL